jgi:hypothetical protein
MYVIGCPSCINTAPMPEPAALVFMIKDLLMSGRDKTGGLTIAFLRSSKGKVASWSQPTTSFLRSLVRG